MAEYFHCPNKKGAPKLHIKVHKQCPDHEDCPVYREKLGHLPPLLGLYVRLKAEDHCPEPGVALPPATF